METYPGAGSGEISTRQQEAEDAAAVFALPENWRDGRDSVSGWAIDPRATRTRDDALTLTTTPTGEQAIAVHIADAGSFLYDQPALQAFAEERVFARYQETRRVQALWPSRICDEIFSLTDKTEKPALTITLPLDADPESLPVISRSRLQARVASPDEFHGEVEAGNSEAEEMVEIARELYGRRTGRIALIGDSENTIDETAEVIDDKTARFVIREFLLQADAAMARFVIAHDTPAIFPVDREARYLRLALGVSQAALAGSIVKQFTLQHLPDTRYGFSSFLFGSKPLRRLDSFINTANISAKLDGREYPYPFPEIDRFARRMSGYNRYAFTRWYINNQPESSQPYGQLIAEPTSDTESKPVPSPLVFANSRPKVLPAEMPASDGPKTWLPIPAEIQEYIEAHPRAFVRTLASRYELQVFRSASQTETGLSKVTIELVKGGKVIYSASCEGENNKQADRLACRSLIESHLMAHWEENGGPIDPNTKSKDSPISRLNVRSQKVGVMLPNYEYRKDKSSDQIIATVSYTDYDGRTYVLTKQGTSHKDIQNQISSQLLGMLPEPPSEEYCRRLRTRRKR